MPITSKVMALGAEDDGGGVDASLFAFDVPAFCSEGAGRVCGEGAINGEELTAEGDKATGLIFRPLGHLLVCRMGIDLT
jgi:hypothetical protein